LFHSVLVVCVGNICRSPVAERVLSAKLAERGGGIAVTSAGVGALVGHPADDTAAMVALANGVSLEGHLARQFTHQIGLAHDLILVMEPRHRQDIIKNAPDLSGRVMLFDHWRGGRGIPDPFRRAREFHETIFHQIDAAAADWATKLLPRGRN
jgi:protein-tyrosine phosphatase